MLKNQIYKDILTIMSEWGMLRKYCENSILNTKGDNFLATIHPPIMSDCICMLHSIWMDGADKEIISLWNFKEIYLYEQSEDFWKRFLSLIKE